MEAVTAKQAAALVGCRSAAQFRREVQQGIWPPPIAPRSRPQRWSVRQLQAALEPPEVRGKKHTKLEALEFRLGIR